MGIVFYLTDSPIVIPLAIGTAIYSTWNNLIKKKLLKTVGVWVILLIVFMISYMNCRSQSEYGNQYLSEVTDGESVTFCGKVYKREFSNNHYKYYLSNNSKFSVIVYSDDDVMQIDDISLISGKVHKFEAASNEGAFEQDIFYNSQKILFAIYLDKILDIKSPNLSVKKFLYRLKDILGNRMLSLSDEEEAGVLASILIGEKSELSAEIKELYRNVGLSHILAISGMHISLVGMTLYKLLRRRGFGLGASMLVAVGVASGYMFMTGASISAKRACGMFCIMLLAQLLGRTNDILNSLGLILLFLLYDNPFIIYYSGFVFSVVAIIGLAFFVSRIEGSKIKVAVFSSVVMQLCTIPIVAYFNYELPVFAVIVNLLLLPVLTIIFFTGWIAVFCSLLVRYIGHILIFPPIIILRTYDFIFYNVDLWQYSRLIVGRPSVVRIMFYYIVLAIVFELWLKRKRVLYLLAGASILICIILLPVNNGLEVDVLDVGQGDAIYIHTSDGKNIFIDGGSSSDTNIGEEVIIPFLKYKGISKIDYWFISHVDDDHINGFIQVMCKGYRVDNIICGAKDDTAAILANMLEEKAIKHVNIQKMKKKMKLKLKNGYVECLWPGEKEKKTNEDDRNEMCLVLLYEDDGFKGIFAGDIGKDTEEVLAREYGKELACDLYKVDHHGSKNSSSVMWLKEMKPRIAVVSCGKHNSYGHPSKEAIGRIKEEGSAVFYTMVSGQIKIKKRTDGIKVLPSQKTTVVLR